MKKITEHLHVHLQILIKPPAKFQKDLANYLGVVPFTRVDTFCDGHSDRKIDRQTSRRMHGLNNMSSDPDRGT